MVRWFAHTPTIVFKCIRNVRWETVPSGIAKLALGRNWVRNTIYILSIYLSISMSMYLSVYMPRLSLMVRRKLSPIVLPQCANRSTLLRLNDGLCRMEIAASVCPSVAFHPRAERLLKTTQGHVQLARWFSSRSMSAKPGRVSTCGEAHLSCSTFKLDEHDNSP